MSVDLLVVTALMDELDALLNARGKAAADWTVHRDNDGFRYYRTEFDSHSNGPIGVAAVWAGGMGETAAAAKSTKFIQLLKPRFLGMCGICAGNPKETSLGDVVVADRVFSYDHGKIVAHADEDGGATEDFFSDIKTYNLSERMHEDIAFMSRASPLLKSLQESRPISLKRQQQWLLRYLNQNSVSGPTLPNSIVDRKKNCPAWATVVKKLSDGGMVKQVDSGIELSELGRKAANDSLLHFPDELPEPEAFRIHLGPLATGKTVRQDATLFERLSKHSRKLLGIEMEAASIGYVASAASIPSIIVKGVSDFADTDKDDGFRAFSAKASAEVLIGFFLEANESRVAQPSLPRTPPEKIEVTVDNRVSLETQIKVTVTAGTVIGSANDSEIVLSIRVENRGTRNYHHKTFGFLLENGSKLWVQRDALSGAPNSKHDIEPNDSRDFRTGSGDIIAKANGRRVVCAFSTDAVGREFFSDFESFPSVLAQSKGKTRSFFPVKPKARFLDTNNAHVQKKAQAAVSEKVLKAFDFEFQNENRTWAALLTESPRQAMTAHVLELVGMVYKPVWRSAPLHGIVDFFVCDRGDSVPVLCIATSEFGNGAGQRRLVVYSPSADQTSTLTEHHSWQLPKLPIQPEIKIDPPISHEMSQFIGRLGTALGMLQPISVDLESPQYADRWWHAKNPIPENTQILLRLYPRTSLTGGNSPWISSPLFDVYRIHKGPLLAYLKDKDKDVLLFSPSWAYDWVSCAVIFDNACVFGQNHKKGLRVITIGPDGSSGYISTIERVGGVELPEVTTLEKTPGGLMINSSFLIQIEDLVVYLKKMHH